MTTPSSLVVLHTNDIHGRVEGLARIATLVEQVRAESTDASVLYFDLGDVEEPSQRLSNVTKGAAMHRLLGMARCDAAVVGNGAWLRYGPQVLADHVAVARYPLLLANLLASNGGPLFGVRPTTVLELPGLRLGLIGVSAEMGPEYTGNFNIKSVPPAPLIRELAASLRERWGADAVIILSHMGLPADRLLAAELQGQVSAILGGHSHNLLPEGEWVGNVLIAQAGQYAQHLGRLDLSWDGQRLAVTRAGVQPITPDTTPSPRVMAEAATIEHEGELFLAEVIGELAEPLDFATDRECGAADLMADMLRERMRAEVAVVAAGQAFTGPLPRGLLQRGALWDVCSSTANPAAVMLTGAQLAELVAKGLDPAFAADCPHTLRGKPRGLIHLSGAVLRAGRLWIGGRPVEAECVYRVAGSDWEFEPYGGYADPAWCLRPDYEVPIILREALEEYLKMHRPAHVADRRLQE